MEKFNLFSTLLWKNYTNYFITGIFAIFILMPIFSPDTTIWTDTESFKAVLLLYVILRLLTALIVTVLEFVAHLLMKEKE